MGTNLNFKNNFVIDPPTDGNCNGRPPGNFPLARQSSVYSLTFDEFQNTMGGSLGKDFGSMNMDELLKNIWSAEETQTMTNNNNNNSIATGFEGTGPSSSGFLQRQGSLTLPRTLSQKTVDEVWRDLSKDESGNGSASLPQRQQTLGEITLEEFLVRAGVVREDAQLDVVKPDSTAAYFGNSAFGYGFGNTNNINNTSNNNGQFSIQSSNLPLNVNGVRSNQSQLSRSQQQQQQQQQQHQQQQQQHQHQQQQHQLQILPKQQATVGYATHQMAQLGGQGVRGGIVGIGDQGLSSGLVQTVAVLQGAGGGMGMVGLGGGGGAVTVAAGSPVNQLSSDGIGKSNGDMSSVSPVPYGFNGGLRGRRSGAVEKVVERRQRRMIKNRESAARSRARKQAYTMELEAEVAKLKEENQELRKKQAQIKELQKNQVLEIMNKQGGVKKQCLRRTQTGPW